MNMEKNKYEAPEQKSEKESGSNSNADQTIYERGAEAYRQAKQVVSDAYEKTSEKVRETYEQKESFMKTNEKSVAMYGVVPASEIIGEAVVNPEGESVGKILELVIDAGKNRVVYAVLSFGGFMGMRNKLFAIPWEAFEFSETETKLILNVDREKLEAAPGFEKGDKWPDFKDTLWGESIYNYYNYAPPWKP